MKPRWQYFTVICLLVACGSDDYEINFPAAFGAPDIPENNQLTHARVALGEKLFSDPILSVDSTISCMSCHLPHLAFADSLAISPGVEGRLGTRNAPSLMNVAYKPLLNLDGGVTRLDLQAMVPIEDEEEMDLHILHAVDRIQSDSTYIQMSRQAYRQDPSAFVVTRALASFVRTLISEDTPYDRFMLGDTLALTPSAQRGLALFTSDSLNCTSCHQGPLMTNHQFANTGTSSGDLGRAIISLDSMDYGKFRVPSLRNVGITAPYMHDGSLPTLTSVLRHYQIHTPDSSSLISPLLGEFDLTRDDEQDLISFLKSLTDYRYLAQTTD